MEDYRNGDTSTEDILRSVVSYLGDIARGHVYKPKNKVMGDFVLKRQAKRSDAAAESEDSLPEI